MTQQLTEAANMVGEVERQSVSDLLNHISTLHKAIDVLLDRLEHANRNCLIELKTMMDLSHRVIDSLNVMLVLAWMLETQGENIDSDRLERHFSIIREGILRLLNELKLAGISPELSLNLKRFTHWPETL